MEDIAEWERTLQGAVTCSPLIKLVAQHISDAWPLPPGASALPTSPDLPPSEFDEEEIAERAAQAEEAELWAELDGADIIDLAPKSQAILDEDVDMA